MVNDYTHQQIRSTTICRQRVVIDKCIGSYVDRYNQNKTTVWNDKRQWKRSKRTMEAIKSELQQFCIYDHIQCFTVVLTDPL